MDANKEAALMIAAMQMATRVDAVVPRNMIRREDEARADLIKEYQACYALLAELGDESEPGMTASFGRR